jgi:mRNA-degrading endonuclease YafQ of YafQ-DinJ toxin-antitoxin module
MSSQGSVKRTEYVPLPQLGTEELCHWLQDNARLSDHQLQAAMKVMVEQEIEGDNFLMFQCRD